MVAGTREAVALADKAAALPFVRFPGGTEFNYRASGMAHLWSLLTARTLQLSAAGDGDAAVESILSSLKLRSALREGRWFMYPEDRQVAAVLSLTRPSAPSLQRLDDALAKEDKPEAQVQSFLQERGRYVGMIWRRYYGTDPSAPRQYTLPMRGVTATLMRPWFTHQAVGVLQLWSELAVAAKVPWPEKAAAGDRVAMRVMTGAEYRPRLPFGMLTSRSLPVEAFAQVIDATALIVDRASRVAVAVERFERDRKARPASITELVPQYLAGIPQDPYTGSPLQYRRAADRYTIYSVGPNKKDDGGDLTSDFQAAGKRGQKYRRIRGADAGVVVLVRP